MRSKLPPLGKVTKAWLGTFAALSVDSLEAQGRPDSVLLPSIVVTATHAPQKSPFLPPVDGTKITSGKKTQVIRLDDMPKIVNHNYRQALAATPGLVLAEDVMPLLSVGYRGLNPYRTQFTQVMKDGIPLTMDMFGYPEAYYTPALDGVDRIEFLHGGASLMYGPQPGGSLNYITHRPRMNKKLVFKPEHTVGSDKLYTTYNSIDGTTGRLGYYGDFHHRQWDGFRKTNSDLGLFSGSGRLILDAASHSRWVLSVDAYTEEHGEAGGLTKATGPNTVNYDTNRNGSSRTNDRFRLERKYASLGWERDFGEETQLTVKGWHRYNYRLSRRQLGGGFGVIPTGPNSIHNAIQLQQFYNEGVDARFRRHWVWNGNVQTIAAGGMLYHTNSPRTDKLGPTPDAKDGPLQQKNVRKNSYVPLFVENRFKMGRFSVTPGVRLENLWQSVNESVNAGKTAAGKPLGDRKEFTFIPLGGIGMEYELVVPASVYANFSQSYRPKLFTEAVPLEPLSVINDDLKEGRSRQFEIGFRGNPTDYASWDVSAFQLDFDNQIGAVSLGSGVTSVQNVGHARHRGVEASVQFDVLWASDVLRGQPNLKRRSTLSVYGNAMLLDAKFVAGPQNGKSPQHAPDFTVRTGTIYSVKNRMKVGLTGTFNGQQFADDNNTANFRVPGYSVWDATAEAAITEKISIQGGVNNLLDRHYYSRIRAEGIDPAYGRNQYLGVSLTL
ncbi:MAG TPA: TonB-dependent receptor [Gemmatimonadaceae bacterium]|nr:TonB-dependent receptor [Gemmatimonadaceae bacterium]